MIDTTFSAAKASLRGLSPVAVLLGTAMLLGACTPDHKVHTTTTEQTTTRQSVPASIPSSSTTTTRTQQTVP
jgi:hypothetical protein